MFVSVKIMLITIIIVAVFLVPAIRLAVLYERRWDDDDK